MGLPAEIVGTAPVLFRIKNPTASSEGNDQGHGQCPKQDVDQQRDIFDEHDFGLTSPDFRWIR